MTASLRQLLKVTLASALACGVLLVGLKAGGALTPFSTAQATSQATSQPKARPAAKSAYPHRSAQVPGGLALTPAQQEQQGPLGEGDGDIPVGDSLTVSGQPMSLSLFVTSDTPAQVSAYYADAFDKRGLLPITHGDNGLGHVSVFDPDDGLQRFVTALPQKSGETLVMVGSTSPKHAPRLLGGAKTAPFPVPDEQRGFLGYSSEDNGTHAQSGQYVTSLPVAALRKFYQDELVKGAGFTALPDTGDALWVFTKGGLSITVAVQALSKEGGAAVFVNRVEGEAP